LNLLFGLEFGGNSGQDLGNPCHKKNIQKKKAQKKGKESIWKSAKYYFDLPKGS